MTSSCRPWIPEDLARYVPRPPPVSADDNGSGRGAGRVAVAGAAPEAPPPPAERSPAPDPQLARVRGLLERLESAGGALLEQVEPLTAALREQALAEGYQAGHAQGLSQGSEAAEEAREAALGLVRQAGELRERAVEDARDELVEVALALARRIIRREVYADPVAVTDMVDEALDVLPRGTEVLVRAHPSSIVVLREHRGSTVAAGDGAYHLTYMSDESMEPGDFLFDTVYGQLDGRVEVQLARLAEEARRYVTTGGEDYGD